MKKLLVVGAALISLGVPAIAADLPVKAVPLVVPYFSWTGCYVGATVGYEWGTSHQTYGGLAGGLPAVGTIPAGTELTPNYKVNGVTGGAELGCNYQVGSWVYGVEVDGSLSSAQGQTLTSPAATAFVNPNLVFASRQHWLATARGRLGYAVDKWLVYATGGVAFARYDLNNYLPASIFQMQPERVTKAGLAIGGGVEYALSYGWSLKAEALYIDFGKLHYGDVPIGCLGGGGCPNADVRTYEWTARVGVNYRFGLGPVVAKY